MSRVINMPLCYKCSSRKVRPSEDARAMKIVGCRELTDAEWSAGWFAEEGEPVFQHRCPLLGDKE